MSPQALIFFLVPPFQNLGLKVVPLAKRGTDTVLILLIYEKISLKIYLG